jgi:hypothetical protein
VIIQKRNSHTWSYKLGKVTRDRKLVCKVILTHYCCLQKGWPLWLFMSHITFEAFSASKHFPCVSLQRHHVFVYIFIYSESTCRARDARTIFETFTPLWQIDRLNENNVSTTFQPPRTQFSTVLKSVNYVFIVTFSLHLHSWRLSRKYQDVETHIIFSLTHTHPCPALPTTLPSPALPYPTLPYLPTLGP